jgi:hypothetical protein
MGLNIEITDEDIAAARVLGATGTQLLERAVQSALDRAGVPREGRTVIATPETITIDLPPGWTLPPD